MRRQPSTPMPENASSKAIEKLTSAITRLDAKVTQLTVRLTGDAGMQTTGLIHELAETRQDLVSVQKSNDKQDQRILDIERQNSSQAGILEDLRIVRLLTDKLWKVVALFIAGGICTPLAASLWGRLFAAR